MTLAALERELQYEDVACVLAEPVMTNCGIGPARSGLSRPVARTVRRDTARCCVIDETHTFSTGWGGYTRAFGLKPDFVTLGKCIAGGIPVAAYGFTEEIKARINASFGPQGGRRPDGDRRNAVPATPLPVHAMRRTLEEVGDPAGL